MKTLKNKIYTGLTSLSGYALHLGSPYNTSSEVAEATYLLVKIFVDATNVSSGSLQISVGFNYGVPAAISNVINSGDAGGSLVAYLRIPAGASLKLDSPGTYTGTFDAYIVVSKDTPDICADGWVE